MALEYGKLMNASFSRKKVHQCISSIMGSNSHIFNEILYHLLEQDAVMALAALITTGCFFKCAIFCHCSAKTNELIFNNNRAPGPL